MSLPLRKRLRHVEAAVVDPRFNDRSAVFAGNLFSGNLLYRPRMRYWLLKSEPGDYAIDDLARDRRDWWTGIRNYQSRNFMMHDMTRGDGVLFYHSSCPAPGVYGIARVSAAARPDPTQFDHNSKYYDNKSSPQNPIWHCVQVAFVAKLSAPILLPALRANVALAKMRILQRGNRLSITPITASEWRIIAGKHAALSSARGV